VKENSKRLVTEVYLEGIMQKLTETGNAWMQHLLAQVRVRVGAYVHAHRVFRACLLKT
jgi:hypothetical protein